MFGFWKILEGFFGDLCGFVDLFALVTPFRISY